MKKIIKLSATLITSLMLLVSSGCSCKLSTKKVDERSRGLSNTALELAGTDELTDYVVTYKIFETDYMTRDISETEYVVLRDIDSDRYHMSTTSGRAHSGETIVSTTVKEEMYESNGDIKHVVGEEVTILPSRYVSLEEAFQNGSGYYEKTSLVYNYYKMIPLNACSSHGDHEQLPYYANTNRVLKCKSKRKLFGKTTTYSITYRRTYDEFSYIDITTDGNQKIVEVKEVIKRKEVAIKTITLNISYDNIDLTK